jgi:hypothetical protein
VLAIYGVGNRILCIIAALDMQIGPNMNSPEAIGDFHNFPENKGGRNAEFSVIFSTIGDGI